MYIYIYIYLQEKNYKTYVIIPCSYIYIKTTTSADFPSWLVNFKKN